MERTICREFSVILALYSDPYLFAPALPLLLCVQACLHCSLQYEVLIVLLGGKRPLIVVTKTSGSYSHSNKNISFPRAEFINYAFLLQDLYFLRQELECMLNFLLNTRAAPPTASPLQLLPRQLIEKCSVALRILIHSYLCTHIALTHPGNSFFALVCVYQCGLLCMCLHLLSMNYSQTQPAVLCCFSFHLIQPHRIFYLPYYCESEVKDYI